MYASERVRRVSQVAACGRAALLSASIVRLRSGAVVVSHGRELLGGISHAEKPDTLEKLKQPQRRVRYAGIVVIRVPKHSIPDLVHGQFEAPAPDVLWVGDITYIRTWEGWLYLATVIDVFSRRVVGFALAGHMRASLVCDALAMAVATRGGNVEGVIFHSDRGSQYTSAEFLALCDAHGVKQSMGKTGVCWDNALAESFFATYKLELIEPRSWPTRARTRTATVHWIEAVYNRQRRHSAIDMMSPIDYEDRYWNRRAAA